MSRPKALVSWSSGKDSAWALHETRQSGDFEIVGLLTTINEVHDRVAMHAVRNELLDAQATAAGLPLWKVPLPDPCTNEDYEAKMKEAVGRARDDGITHMIFGDLYLEDRAGFPTLEKEYRGAGARHDGSRGCRPPEHGEPPTSTS